MDEPIKIINEDMNELDKIYSVDVPESSTLLVTVNESNKNLMELMIWGVETTNTQHYTDYSVCINNDCWKYSVDYIAKASNEFTLAYKVYEPQKIYFQVGLGEDGSSLGEDGSSLGEDGSSPLSYSITVEIMEGHEVNLLPEFICDPLNHGVGTTTISTGDLTVVVVNRTTMILINGTTVTPDYVTSNMEYTVDGETTYASSGDTTVIMVNKKIIQFGSIHIGTIQTASETVTDTVNGFSVFLMILGLIGVFNIRKKRK